MTDPTRETLTPEQPIPLTPEQHAKLASVLASVMLPNFTKRECEIAATTASAVLAIVRGVDASNADAQARRVAALEAENARLQRITDAAGVFGQRFGQDLLEAALTRAEAAEAERDNARAKLYAWTVESVTAGANPRNDGTMSPPMFHVSCKICGARWSKTTWKREEADSAHPASDCLNAPTTPPASKETP